MSAEGLKDCLVESANTLEEIASILANAGSGPNAKVREKLEQIRRLSGILRRSVGLVDYRTSCWEALISVRDQSDENENTSVVNGTTLSYEQARYLVTQAYLALMWALADSITSVGGEVFCTIKVVSRDYRSANLWQHFTNKQCETTPSFILSILRENYAWPISISYIIRNLFAHEGGGCKDYDFFAGKTVADRFEISRETNQRIRKQLNSNYKTEFSQSVAGDIFETTELDVILERCGREVDRALIVVACLAARTARDVANLICSI